MSNWRIGLIRLLDAIDARRSPNFVEEQAEYNKGINLMSKYKDDLWVIDEAVKKIEKGEL